MSEVLTHQRTIRDDRWRAPTLPRPGSDLALLAIAMALAISAASFWVIGAIKDAIAQSGANFPTITTLLWIAGALPILLFIPALRAFNASHRAREAITSKDIVTARVQSAAARDHAFRAYGYGAAVVLILTIGLFIIANKVAVGLTFFKLSLIWSSFGLVLHAFGTNVYIFCIAEILVLVWGLVVAVARLLPGEAGRPIRMIATAYTDVFRALPAIITIYLVGFGLPLTGLPIVKDFPPEWYAILALTLTYGAYVAEVYRAGIESIHWSQTAAARSLGLGFGQTLRFVVVPQAVRRIIPPLLNDFISLQKDTALVNVIGTIDAFNQAKIVASNHFNLSSVTTVAFLFIVITIPQTRFVDRLIERDQRRMRAGG
ncbi:MAG TPA: amino acid ABC transporter permease [Dongiaceae bacterium]